MKATVMMMQGGFLWRNERWRICWKEASFSTTKTILAVVCMSGRQSQEKFYVTHHLVKQSEVSAFSKILVSSHTCYFFNVNRDSQAL